MGGMSWLHWLIVLFALGLKFGLALIPAKIASEKGRDFQPWLIYGFFFFTIATIHALVLRPQGEALVRQTAKLREQISQGDARACPACDELMRPEIATCGACGAAMKPA